MTLTLTKPINAKQQRSIPTRKRGDYRVDAFDNLVVWLPYGIAGNKVEGYGPHDDYVITREMLEDADNNSTLAGLDVTHLHPEQGLITPDNPAPVVGNCTGRYRDNDGVFEVEAIIKNADVIKMIRSNDLTETSAAYVESLDGSKRIYNQIALVPTGYARNGRAMRIKLESIPINPLTPMTPEQMLELTENIVNTLKTESTSLKELISQARQEGLEEGMQIGALHAGLIIKAESFGIKEENAEATARSLISKYLPKLESVEVTNAQLFAFADAALAVAHSMAEKKEEVTEATVEVEDIKIESMKVPSGLTIDVPGGTVNKKSAIKTSNFLL